MSSSNWGSFTWRFEIPPGNSAFVVPFDSTRNIFEQLLASQAANPAPGVLRGKKRRAMISYTILTTGQNVTVNEQDRTAFAGTNADWSTQGGAAGTATVTAGTPTVREFRPLSPDWRVLVTAGATGPTTLVFDSTISYTEDFGG